MSRVMTVDADQVQFVLKDVEDINTEGLSDIIYSDGTRAILVNSTGQVIQSDMQTVVLQDDDFNQYYINNENGEILIADEQDNSLTQSLQGAEVVQFVEDDGNATVEPQVIYINEEGYALNDSDLLQYQVEDDTEEVLSTKAIKLETQVVDLEELMRQQGDNQTVIDSSGEENRYQYAVLKDGKLHIQSYNGDIYPITSEMLIQDENSATQNISEDQDFDLSQITGRNLLTGQTVTLHSYMDKLQKKIKDSTLDREPGVDSEALQKKRMTSCVGLQGLLHKKLTLGKTTSGKRLVGKVIHVEKKNTVGADKILGESIQGVGDSELAMNTLQFDPENSQLADIEDSDNLLKFDEDRSTTLLADLQPLSKPLEKSADKPRVLDDKKILIQEKLVSKECFGHVSRTLSGLMNMDSVRKKLQYKSIIVKVVERRQDETTNSYTKKVSYTAGHMEEEFVVNDEGEMLENWAFLADNNIKAALFGLDEREDEGSNGNQFRETTNVTVVITHEKNNHRAIRVILNPTNTIHCSICKKEFHNNLQLKVHLINAHSQKAESRLTRSCEVCGLHFVDLAGLKEHQMLHVEEGKLFSCSIPECGKFFLTFRRLQRHSAVHNNKTKLLECSFCLQKCSSELSLKKHLIMHMNVKHFSCETCGKRFTNPGDLNFHKRIHDRFKYYSCDICKRTFSRHSNLQRHIEIHKGSEELYRCSICGCSYHYMSSLTRHVVQNHINRTSSETPSVAENDVEEV